MSIEQRNKIAELERRVAALERLCAATGLDQDSAKAALDALNAARRTIALPEKRKSA